MFSRRTEWELEPNRLTLEHLTALERGEKIIDLTLSNPTASGIRYNQAAVLGALQRPEVLSYQPAPKGMLCAREAVAGYYASRNGGESLDVESLVLTASTSEAYSHLFRLLCDNGEEILVAQPSYPLMDLLASLDDVRLVPYRLVYDQLWQIDFHSIERALSEKTRALVVVHPNNPSGSYVKEKERVDLNRLCRERDLALIVDEVFLDYAHDGRARSSFTANHDALTFTLSGLSKISALPQMKLGWIHVSGARDQVETALHRLEIIADTFLSVSTPIQLAADVLLAERRTVAPQLMERIRRNLRELDRQLAAQTSCARLLAEGGWYAVIRLPGGTSDEDFSLQLLRQASVLVHPGYFYDFPGDGYLVLSLIVEEEDFSRGVAALFALANQRS